MALKDFVAAPAPRFPTINAFPVWCNVTRWTCIYMKLDQGKWSWASKCVTGTVEEIRAGWATSLMSPMEGEYIETKRTLTPPREWNICQDDQAERTWIVLRQYIEDGEVHPRTIEFVGRIEELRLLFPRAIWWPKG